MDGFVDFVVSINKVALLAFVVVLAFLLFEIKKMMDEKRKKEKPVVPQFNDKMQQKPAAVNSTPLPAIVPLKKNEKTVNPLLMIAIGIISLVGVVVIMVASYKTSVNKQRTASIPIVRQIQSAGLKVYDTNWMEIEKKKNEKAKPGEKLYIGLLTIVESDIDRARIKVNANDWQISDITTLFNPKLKVYYREYIVATGTAQLKIDAQLHSASDGWLSD
ncbi:MAG: hypothetical protein NTZ55_03375 [Candidatus Roizmanbacteria bacterium]|nr:hypothetical protein [Candidatus Roizmanbacteria bacterium]